MDTIGPKIVISGDGQGSMLELLIGQTGSINVEVTVIFETIIPMETISIISNTSQSNSFNPSPAENFDSNYWSARWSWIGCNQRTWWIFYSGKWG